MMVFNADQSKVLIVAEKAEARFLLGILTQYCHEMEGQKIYDDTVKALREAAR